MSRVGYLISLVTFIFLVLNLPNIIETSVKWLPAIAFIDNVVQNFAHGIETLLPRMGHYSHLTYWPFWLLMALFIVPTFAFFLADGRGGSVRKPAGELIYVLLAGALISLAMDTLIFSRITGIGFWGGLFHTGFWRYDRVPDKEFYFAYISAEQIIILVLTIAFWVAFRIYLKVVADQSAKA